MGLEPSVTQSRVTPPAAPHVTGALSSVTSRVARRAFVHVGFVPSLRSVYRVSRRLLPSVHSPRRHSIPWQAARHARQQLAQSRNPGIGTLGGGCVHRRSLAGLRA